MVLSKVRAKLYCVVVYHASENFFYIFLTTRFDYRWEPRPFLLSFYCNENTSNHKIYLKHIIADRRGEEVRKNFPQQYVLYDIKAIDEMFYILITTFSYLKIVGRLRFELMGSIWWDWKVIRKSLFTEEINWKFFTFTLFAIESISHASFGACNFIWILFATD